MCYELIGVKCVLACGYACMCMCVGHQAMIICIFEVEDNFSTCYQSQTLKSVENISKQEGYFQQNSYYMNYILEAFHDIFF